MEEKNIPKLAKIETDFSPFSFIKHFIVSINKNMGEIRNKIFVPGQWNILNTNAKTKKTK